MEYFASIIDKLTTDKVQVDLFPMDDVYATLYFPPPMSSSSSITLVQTVIYWKSASFIIPVNWWCAQ
jgi:hypothetical protein